MSAGGHAARARSGDVMWRETERRDPSSRSIIEIDIDGMSTIDAQHLAVPGHSDCFGRAVFIYDSSAHYAVPSARLSVFVRARISSRSHRNFFEGALASIE